jgi:hypothetical protein
MTLRDEIRSILSDAGKDTVYHGQDVDHIIRIFLKHIPERKKMPNRECICAAWDESECGCGNFPNQFNQGWNACLDEITKGEMR